MGVRLGLAKHLTGKGSGENRAAMKRRGIDIPSDVLQSSQLAKYLGVIVLDPSPPFSFTHPHATPSLGVVS